MREILFRGKRIDNGEWVEGDLIHSYLKTGDTCIWCDDGIYQVDPSTVGQYTGLTDKNGGRKIFEGDVISSNNGRISSVMVVKCGEFFPKMFYAMLDSLFPNLKHIPSFGFHAKSVDKGEEMFLFQSPLVEIIGNIHDNPELLEEAK